MEELCFTEEKRCGVFVAGAGLAGIMAAIAAAENGADVILASSAQIFSGSSFYPGTWGLGLVGPENVSDEDDLVHTILEAGCQMADERLVRSFVEGILPAIEKLEKMGIRLKQAENNGERDFIPCFDHKRRRWNGILFEQAKEALYRRMRELHIELMPNCSVLELIREQQRVCGVLALEKGLKPMYIACGAFVLATGGYGGIYQHHLATEDISGVGQYLALQSGCSLINMEFMQMMPGYLTPCYKTIFNEKTFRYADIRNKNGKRMEEDISDAQRLLEIRSTHGPFTCRLPSKEIDFWIAGESACTQQGVMISYKDCIKRETPEFVRTYFDWLKESRNLTMDDSIEVGIFAHAANGGVRIDEHAATGVEGLFACGEVTGGMHGADRIGGLSTANGLVFGQRAGHSAAIYAGKHGGGHRQSFVFSPWEVEGVQYMAVQLRHIMTEAGMIIRSQEKLIKGIEGIKNLQKSVVRKDSDSWKNIAASRQLTAQMTLAQAILRAEALRRESRGSHYRQDYPQTDAACARRICITGADANYIEFEE